jgi:hypothetical protein
VNSGRLQSGSAWSVAPVRLGRAAALLSLILLPAVASPQDYSVDFYTIDGGGEILAESADQRWQLSGTLGQWDSSESLELSGGGYTLTGGFWGVNIDETDLLFSDGFEG